MGLFSSSASAQSITVWSVYTPGGGQATFDGDWSLPADAPGLIYGLESISVSYPWGPGGGRGRSPSVSIYKFQGVNQGTWQAVGTPGAGTYTATILFRYRKTTRTPTGDVTEVIAIQTTKTFTVQ